MKQRIILHLLFLVGLASIISGCSWVSKLTNSPWALEQVLPQAQKNTTIDFYVIDLKEFPVEREILRQELQKLIERVRRPVKIKEFDLSLPTSILSQLPPPPSFLIDILFGNLGNRLTSSKRKSQLDIIEEAIIAKAKKNKEKFLVASIRNNPIDPAELCHSFEKVHKGAARAGMFYIDMDYNDTILRNKVYKILKNCSWGVNNDEKA